MAETSRAITVIDSIYDHPATYWGESAYPFTSLVAFMNGVPCGNSSPTLVPGDFHQFVTEHFGLKYPASGHGWSSLILEYTESEEEAFELFFKLRRKYETSPPEELPQPVNNPSAIPLQIRKFGDLSSLWETKNGHPFKPILWFSMPLAASPVSGKPSTVEVLENLRKRPALYWGDSDHPFTSLVAFMQGVMIASDDPPPVDFLPTGFLGFVRDQFGKTGEPFWGAVLREQTASEQEAFDLFFVLRLEYENRSPRG